MSIERVREYLNNFGLGDKIQEFDVSSATVELASQALGCDMELIAKTLSFKLGERVLLVVVAGNRKIDNSKFKQEFGGKAVMLGFDEVEAKIGHGVGGVCPFGVNAGVEIYLDNSLKDYDYVYPACGSSNSAIKLTIKELEGVTNYIKWVDVSKIKEV